VLPNLAQGKVVRAVRTSVGAEAHEYVHGAVRKIEETMSIGVDIANLWREFAETGRELMMTRSVPVQFGSEQLEFGKLACFSKAMNGPEKPQGDEQAERDDGDNGQDRGKRSDSHAHKYEGVPSAA
jgi:hypothetical protein